MGAAQAEAGRRGLLRPLLGRPLPQWHAPAALAAGQIAEAVHDGSGEAEEGGFDEAAGVTRMMAGRNTPAAGDAALRKAMRRDDAAAQVDMTSMHWRTRPLGRRRAWPSRRPSPEASGAPPGRPADRPPDKPRRSEPARSRSPSGRSARARSS